MTTTLFLTLLALIVLGAVGAFALITSPAVMQFTKRSGTMPPAMITAVSILFGLFVGFSSAEITQRGGGLRLATQREVSAARSILNFTTGVGPRAFAVGEAIIEYLQVVTTTERDWLRLISQGEGGAVGEAPGSQPVYSLILITTGFVQQPGVSDVLKAALINRVEELTNARTDRLTLSRGTGSIPQWIALAALAIVTQVAAALALAGQRGGGTIFIAAFTASALVGLIYLGWADGLIGPTRSQEQTAPFAALLGQAPRLTVAEDDTMARMRNGGRVVIGARTDTFPFAYRDAHGDVAGYAIDLCRGLVERVRTSAGLGPVQVDVLALSPANRIAMIVNSTADMECDLTTETNIRDEQVDFLDPIFYGKQEVVLPPGSAISDLAGLKGKRMIVVVGSSNVTVANELDRSQHLGLTIVPARDTPEGFRMLGAGEGDAMISSDILIRTLVAQASHPAEYRTVGLGLEARTYRLMIRHGNDAFKAAATNAMRDMVRAGEFARIYDRWFMGAPPVGGATLNLPMSAALRQRLDAAAQ